MSSPSRTGMRWPPPSWLEPCRRGTAAFWWPPHVADAYPGDRPRGPLVVEGGDPVTVTVAGVFDATKTAAFGGGHGNLGLDAAVLYAPAGLFQQLLPGAGSP